MTFWCTKCYTCQLIKLNKKSMLVHESKIYLKKKKEKEEQFVDFGTCLLVSLLGAIK